MPPSRTSLNYLDLPAGHIQIFTTLPQGLWQISGPGTGLSSFLIYHGECGSPALKLTATPPSPLTLFSPIADTGNCDIAPSQKSSLPKPFSIFVYPPPPPRKKTKYESVSKVVCLGDQSCSLLCVVISSPLSFYSLKNVLVYFNCICAHTHQNA